MELRRGHSWEEKVNEFGVNGGVSESAVGKEGFLQNSITGITGRKLDGTRGRLKQALRSLKKFPKWNNEACGKNGTLKSTGRRQLGEQHVAETTAKKCPA